MKSKNNNPGLCVNIGQGGVAIAQRQNMVNSIASNIIKGIAYD